MSVGPEWINVKTKNELQKIVDEIRAVCRTHGVVLVGTCNSESIYGEITIGEPASIMWKGVSSAVDNTVEGDDKKGYWVIGIGEVDA